MKKYRKKMPTFEAIQFNGDAKQVIELVGEEKVFVKPATGATFIQTLFGLEYIEEGCYILKNGDDIQIYSVPNFEATFEPAIDFSSSQITINSISPDYDIRGIIESLEKTLHDTVGDGVGS